MSIPHAIAAGIAGDKLSRTITGTDEVSVGRTAIASGAGAALGTAAGSRTTLRPSRQLLGTAELRGNLAPFAGLLHLGQWLHVGKNASFGLGGYRLAA